MYSMAIPMKYFLKENKLSEFQVVINNIYMMSINLCSVTLYCMYLLYNDIGLSHKLSQIYKQYP